MKTALVMVVALGACGGSTPARQEPRSADARGLPPPVAEPPKPAACEDRELMKHARGKYDCAIEQMKRGEYKAAAELAHSIQALYPYSAIAVLSQELHADILFAAEQYADAAEEYDRFI